MNKLHSALLIASVATASLITGCDDASTSSTSDLTENGPSTEELVDDLFQAILDGVQLIEAADAVQKQASELDESTAPPSYTVAYEGCAAGFSGGSFCVTQGRHVVDVIAPDVHIIRTVDQTYQLDGFSSVPDFGLSGELASHVDVAVNTDAQTTEVSGDANGTLNVTGALSGDVIVDLSVSGGRNYTESVATPLEVRGTLTYKGKAYAVEGGFQRE